MNQAALKQGIFAFNHPDFLGMPAYEFLTWGFYTLHTLRFLNGPPPQGRWITALVAAGAFALAFGTIADPNLLFLATASMLVVFFAMYHGRWIWPNPATWPWWVNWSNTSGTRLASGTILDAPGAASRCGY
jgi:hypothetical protein